MPFVAGTMTIILGKRADISINVSPTTTSSTLAVKETSVNDGNETVFGGRTLSDRDRAIRYGIFFSVIFVSLAFFIIGRTHAKMRMRKGLPLLAYHHWLVRKSGMGQTQLNPPSSSSSHQVQQQRQPEEDFSFYGADVEYQLNSVPPPAYNPNLRQPPAYPGPPLTSSAAPKPAPGQGPPPYDAGDRAAVVDVPAAESSERGRRV